MALGKAAADGPRTPLQRCCSMASFGDEDVEVVRALLESGADPNEMDCFGRSALALLCSQSGHTGVASALLEFGADASTQDMWGRTPLHWCSDRGWLDTALLLLDKGASVNVTTKNGDTPLLWASKAGNQCMAEHLLKAGADPLLRNNRDEQAADVAADDVTRVLITSVGQERDVSTDDIHPLLHKQQKQIFKSEPASLCEIEKQTDVSRGDDELKRPAAPQETASTRVVPPTSTSFSLYHKQSLPPGTGPKKLKITLKKK